MKKAIFLAGILLSGVSFGGESSSSSQPLNLGTEKAVAYGSCKKINDTCWVNAQCCSKRCSSVTRRCRPVGGTNSKAE